MSHTSVISSSVAEYFDQMQQRLRQSHELVPQPNVEAAPDAVQPPIKANP
jgi:hypothetical protein